ncbi:hypothetical protein Q5752_006274 [Cryptotrichosporon argae]
MDVDATATPSAETLDALASLASLARGGSENSAVDSHGSEFAAGHSPERLTITSVTSASAGTAWARSTGGIRASDLTRPTLSGAAATETEGGQKQRDLGAAADKSSGWRYDGVADHSSAPNPIQHCPSSPPAPAPASSAPTQAAPFRLMPLPLPAPATPLAHFLSSPAEAPCIPPLIPSAANNSDERDCVVDTDTAPDLLASAQPTSIPGWLLAPHAVPALALAAASPARPRPIKVPKSYAARRSSVSPYPYPASATPTPTPSTSMAPADWGERFSAHSPAAPVTSAAFADSPSWFSSPSPAPAPVPSTSRPGADDAHSASGWSLKSPTGSISTANRQRAPTFPNVRRRVSPPELMSPTTPAALRVAQTPGTPPFYRQGYAALAPARPPYPPVHPYASGRAAHSAPAPTPIRLPVRPRPGAGPGLGPGATGVDPALLDAIPREYVIRRLNEMAGKFWTAPHTTDCTLREYLGGKEVCSAAR